MENSVREKQLNTIKNYINSKGCLLTVNNGMKLPLDDSSHIQKSGMWKGSTVDVYVIGHDGVGRAYFVKSRKVWYFSGLAPFDVLFDKKILSSPKFITEKQYSKLIKK